MSYARGWGLKGEAPPFSGSTLTGDGVCARRIGQTARRLVAQGCSGRVLAVVTGAVYLLTEDGELCWLAPGDVSMHTRAISVPSVPGTVQPGARFVAQDGRVQLEGPSVDCTTSALWDPPAIDPDHIAGPPVVRERVRQLHRYAECDGLPERMTGIVRDVRAACLEREWARMAWSCQQLIGMGPGLTPSGDDFVGGLVFTLHYLHALYPDRVDWDRSLVHCLLDHASTQTNVISYHLLCDYAEGQAAEPLYRLLIEILSEEPSGSLAESARQLLDIGNTTGAEMLAGALTAMRFLDRRGDSDD